jgi:hypothetical protein
MTNGKDSTPRRPRFRVVSEEVTVVDDPDGPLGIHVVRDGIVLAKGLPTVQAAQEWASTKGLAWRSVPTSEVAAAGGRLDPAFYLARSNAAMPKVHITMAALARLTPAQLSAIQTMMSRPEWEDDVEVFVAFELPEDYVAFTYRKSYGGIDAEGGVST